MDCTVHKLVADVALVAENRVLFVRYRDTARYDGETGWFLPDDFLAHLEHPDEAARRILREQAAGTAAEPRLAEIESFDGGAWHLVFHYVAAAASAEPVVATGNVAQAEWFPRDDLPPAAEVAHHGWGLQTLERVLTPGA
jgi:ADP-ribose pyrophosphatase YjhB (NUDIX family)